jgi:hypothetical protein
MLHEQRTVCNAGLALQGARRPCEESNPPAAAYCTTLDRFAPFADRHVLYEAASEVVLDGRSLVVILTAETLGDPAGRPIMDPAPVYSALGDGSA